MAKVQIFGETIVPDITTVTGLREIMKAKNSKGNTLKRSGKKTLYATQTERDLLEEKRRCLVMKQGKCTGALSSDMNACQALVGPDCTKHKVAKSTGIPLALSRVPCSALGMEEETTTQKAREAIMSAENLIHFGQREIPENISNAVKLVTVQFAGVKFRTGQGLTGTKYIQLVERSYISKLLSQFPLLKRIVICEEKYSYIPDEFKAAT